MRHDGEFAGFYAANYGRTVALVTMLLGDRNEAETSRRRHSLGPCCGGPG